jgi:two-component system, OmpR family, alkaline phosphatase synthesis response regulator PhoP
MKILIIDDEDDIRLAVRTLLEMNGYAVLEGNGGKKGLAVLQKEKVDLVLCDFFMPGMNGRQVLESIRADAKLKDLKVILLTVATFGKEGDAKLKQLKVADYIRKPFDNKDLLARIKKVLGK